MCHYLWHPQGRRLTGKQRMQDGTSQGERGRSEEATQPERDKDVPLRGGAWCPCRPPLHTLCHASLLAIPKSPALVILPFFPIALRLDFRMATLGGQESQGPTAGISHALQCRGSCEQWGQPSGMLTLKAGGHCGLGGQQHSSTAETQHQAGP